MAELHPRETMDDITEVSSTKEIAKVNTITINKNMEVQTKTFIWLVGGGAAGVAVTCLLYFGFGLPIILSCAIGLAVIAVIPFMALTTVRDATQQKRCRRTLMKIKSKEIEGGVFFPNSSTPENITQIEEVVMKR